MNTVRALEFDDKGVLDVLEAAAFLPGDFECLFWFRQGTFGVDWLPRLPGPDTIEQPGFVERFTELQRGFCDSVATLTGCPVLLKDGYIAYPIETADYGTVH